MVQKLTELDGRLLRIERVLANQSLLDLSQRIEASQNGDAHTCAASWMNCSTWWARRRSSSVSSTATWIGVSRRSKGGATAAQWAHRLARVGGLPVPQGDDRANYQAAFDLLKDGKYPEAISGIQAVPDDVPEQRAGGQRAVLAG